MTTFQKLLVLLLFSVIGFVSFFLYRQERLRKSETLLRQREITLIETQKTISDCKYLLNNKELILENERKRLREAEMAVEFSYDSPRPEYAEEYLARTRDEFVKKQAEYEKSADRCRDILLQVNGG